MSPSSRDGASAVSVRQPAPEHDELADRANTWHLQESAISRGLLASKPLPNTVKSLHPLPGRARTYTGVGLRVFAERRWPSPSGSYRRYFLLDRVTITS